MKIFEGKLMIAIVAAALAQATRPEDAVAFDYVRCGTSKVVWRNATTRMYLNTRSIPPTSSWDVGFQSAINAWTAVPRCVFTFQVGRDTDRTVSRTNGKNEVSFRTRDGRFGALAVTYSRWSCSTRTFLEADIEFDPAETWYTGTPPWLDGGFSFRLVALHELGHALGLLHEFRRLATMMPYYPCGGPIGHSRVVAPHADDCAGARFLYPQSGLSVRDLALTNYKWATGGQSVRITQPTSARRGVSFTLEFTLENRGTASAFFDVGIYLSTNSTIATSDRRLQTLRVSAGPGSVGTVRRTVTIPTSVVPGIYYIGTFADYHAEVLEERETNNYLEAPQTVRVS